MVKLIRLLSQHVCGFEDTIILGAERSASFFVSFFIMICYTCKYEIELPDFIKEL